MKKFWIILLISLCASSIIIAQHIRKNYVERLDNHYTTYLSTDMFSKKITDLNNKDWKFLGNKPCIIDFYTTWCGPCKRLAPTLEKIAENYDGIIDVYKVDAEKEVILSQAFRIRSYPTLVFCPMTGGPRISIGLLSENELNDLIHSILLQEPASTK